MADCEIDFLSTKLILWSNFFLGNPIVSNKKQDVAITRHCIG